MTAVSDAEGLPVDPFAERVAALSRATARLSFDPYADIDWDAPANSLDRDDPRWQLDPENDPLGATDWYAAQPLQRRIDIGRWVTTNTLKSTIQFEMMLIRGAVHYSSRLPKGSPVRRYLIEELVDESNHIQMFQEFINRTGEDVPGMRRFSRFIAPILDFVGGYASNFHFIGILCGEQPLHYQQTLQRRGAAHLPPLLNQVTYIHLAEEARHITFAEDYLAERVERAGRFRRAWYAIIFPIFLRWLIGESVAPPRNFARQYGVPRRVFNTAYWRSAHSRAVMAESAADVRRIAENLGLRTAWSRWIWRLLGVEGRIPRYRSEPDRSSSASGVSRFGAVALWRMLPVAVMAGVALWFTPDGVRIIAVAAAGTGIWAAYHALRARYGNVVGNQSFEWPRLLVWVAVCVMMIPAGGLIGLALVIFMILAVAEFMPTV
jgi:hypothetical protein